MRGPVIEIVSFDRRAEYVDIKNAGGQAQSLVGWVLLSEKGGQTCPLGGVIEPGQALRIWALAEDRDQGGLNCGFGSNIWNNSERDMAVLINNAGQEVDRQ